MDLRRVIAGLPDEALVPVGWVRRQLEGDGDTGRLADLTVAEVAEELGRAASTIRTWCGAGDLPGAYRLRGREWRIPPAALRALRDGDDTQEREDGPVDLGRWREVSGGG